MTVIPETLVIPVSIHYVTYDDVTGRQVTLDILVTFHNHVTSPILVTLHPNVPDCNVREPLPKQGLDQEEYPPVKGLLLLSNWHILESPRFDLLGVLQGPRDLCLGLLLFLLEDRLLIVMIDVL